MTGTTVAGEAWHTLPGLDAAKVLHVEYASGLSSEEAAARFAELGANRLDAAGAEPRWRAFARGYRDALQLVLVAAAAVSLAAGEPATAAVVLVLTLVNAALGLHEEGRPGDPVAALRRDLAVTARVRRDGRIQRLPAELLVPGDMALVEAGEVVPADGRLVDSAALAIDEAALTGESFPAAKAVAAIDDPHAPLGDRTGMAYMGTTVTGGTGELVVTATGMQTEAGQIARTLAVRDRPRPGRMPRRLLLAGGGALMVAAAIQLVRGHDADTVATAGAAFALAAVPTSLPAAVAALLAHGGGVLARAGAAVRWPRAAAELGTASALTVGTAGTLTAGRLTAAELVVPGRRYTVAAGGIRHVAGEREPALEPLLLALALAGDETGGALAELAEKGGRDVAATRAAHPRVAELPFDAAYKLAATFQRMADEPVVRCVVAGAPEPLLSRIATDAASRERYLAESARLSDRGMTVVAIAQRDLRPDTFDPAGELLPLADDLAPLALVGLADPPWPEAHAAVAQARAAGLDVWIVTGDRGAAAEATARAIGVTGRTITGTELAAMSDEDLRSALATLGVIARAEPPHELRIVEALRSGGRVVAATGHRAADAPALAAADIGIATGAGVAAEAAAIVAGDGRLAAIVRIVESARGLRERLDGAIAFQLAAVAGLILTFLGASAFDVAGGMPLEPLQVLYLSFTAVLFQTIGLGYGVAATGLRATAAIAAILAVATLAAMAVAEREHAIDTVRTTGLVTFGVVTVLASLALRRDRALLLASAASVVALVLVA